MCWRCSSSTASTWLDRKSTRLNSSHYSISYAVFCLKKDDERVVRITRIEDGLADDTRNTNRFAVSGYAAHDALEHPTAAWIVFFFNDTGTPEIYPLSPHGDLPT